MFVLNKFGGCEHRKNRSVSFSFSTHEKYMYFLPSYYLGGGADENNLKMIAYEHYWTSKWLDVYGVKPYLSLIIFIQV